MDPETPEADAAEQFRPSVEDTEETESEDTALPRTDDADPGDVAEQQRSVPEEEPYERG